MPDQNRYTEDIRTAHREIDDLIGVAPNWLLRSGIMMVALVVVAVLAISAFIKYPDKIVANGEMTSDHPPIEHFTKTAGIIDSLYVFDGEHITQGMPIAYMQNTMNREDLDQLKAFLYNYINTSRIPNYLFLSFPEDLQLGEISGDYARLQLLYSEFILTLRTSGVFQQVSTLENEIIKTKELRKVMEKEKRFTEEEMKLLEKDVNRSQSLFESGVISQQENEVKQSQWLRFQKQYNNLDNGIIQNKIREEQLRLEIQQLIEIRASTVNTHQYNIQETINTIRQKLQAWEELYYVKATIGGKVAWRSDVSLHSFVAANTLIASIIPIVGEERKYIRAYTPSRGVGKLKEGNKAIIKVDGYPYKEYGTITSSLDAISTLPIEHQSEQGNQYLYELKIALPDTLYTNYDKEIIFKPKAGTTVEVITEDRSILARLFNQLLSLVG